MLLALQKRIVVDNTLEARLELCFEHLKPALRATLFGLPEPVDHSKAECIQKPQAQSMSS